MTADTLIKNAIIESAFIRFDRGTFLSCWLMLDYGGAGQGFGGYVLGGNPFDKDIPANRHAAQPNIAAEFIGAVMAVGGVENFDDLPGKVVRVRARHDRVEEIGHCVKDIWFEPSVALEKLKREAEHD